MRNDMDDITPRMLLEGLVKGVRSIPDHLLRAVDWVAMAKYRYRQRRRWKRTIIIELGDPRYDAASDAVLSKITPDMNTWERLQTVLHADDIGYCIRIPKLLPVPASDHELVNGAFVPCCRFRRQQNAKAARLMLWRWAGVV